MNKFYLIPVLLTLCLAPVVSYAQSDTTLDSLAESIYNINENILHINEQLLDIDDSSERLYSKIVLAITENTINYDSIQLLIKQNEEFKNKIAYLEELNIPDNNKNSVISNVEFWYYEDTETTVLWFDVQSFHANSPFLVTIFTNSSATEIFNEHAIFGHMGLETITHGYQNFGEGMYLQIDTWERENLIPLQSIHVLHDDVEPDVIESVIPTNSTD